jgi:hypothetical protein
VVIMPPSRTFRGAVRLTYTVGQKCQEYRAMVAMLRHAADTWPYLTRVTLECDPRCEALTRWVWSSCQVWGVSKSNRTFLGGATSREPSSLRISQRHWKAADGGSRLGCCWGWR